MTLIIIPHSPETAVINRAISLLNILLSKIWRRFSSFFERGQLSLPYISMGLIRVLYNIHFVCHFKYGEFNCFFNSQLVLLAVIILQLISVLMSLSSVKVVSKYLNSLTLPYIYFVFCMLTVNPLTCAAFASFFIVSVNASLDLPTVTMSSA
jgi:hypothetical protein